jgi:hypothetical protein
MPTEVLPNLLGSIPTGDIIKDPREGDHPEASLKHVELVDQANGKALKLTYGGMTDINGREFEHQERLTIPNTNSHEAVQRIFLSACHSLEIVPRSFRNTILADTDQDQQQIHDAFLSKVGTPISLRLRPDSSGYLKATILRRRAG